jgi:hypothetical protein
VEENLPVGGARFILELPLAPESLPAENGPDKSLGDPAVRDRVIG